MLHRARALNPPQTPRYPCRHRGRRRTCRPHRRNFPGRRRRQYRTCRAAPRKGGQSHHGSAWGSVAALDTLGVWSMCAEKAAPLRTMRIVDDTGRLWRAPEVKFSADEIGLDAFGYNIENRHLIDALVKRARNLPALTIVEDKVVTVSS